MNPNGISYEVLSKYFQFCLEAHENFDATQDEKFRQFNHTPYPTHPIFAAHLLLADRSVPWPERKVGYLALILHDVLENTSAKLPIWVESDVKKIVEELTLDENRNKEEQILEKSDNIKFLIFVDMLSNLYEEHVRPENRERWIKALNILMKILDTKYGNSRVFIIARALIPNTDWSNHHP